MKCTPKKCKPKPKVAVRDEAMLHKPFVTEDGVTIQREPVVENVQQHYHEMDDTEKDLTNTSAGLFAFPEDLQGKTDWGARKQLTIYFDNDDDYDLAVTMLSDGKDRKHPLVDPARLMRLLRSTDG